ARLLLPRLFPYATLFRSLGPVDLCCAGHGAVAGPDGDRVAGGGEVDVGGQVGALFGVVDAGGHWFSLVAVGVSARAAAAQRVVRSEEHTSELQSRENLVC